MFESTIRVLAAIALLVAPGVQPALAQSVSPRHPVTIDDVLDIEHLDRASLSPDGAWAAAVVLRGAKPGEVYGRTAHETDPSRGDIWLVSTRTGEKHRLTDGAPQAAGYWCATWSPDGQRLAFLSTQPKKGEPRGGDNVRLYVWERASGAITRMSDTALMTQTRYGSGIDQLDLRGGADGSTVAHECGEDERAPFLWLDDNRILMATMPPGQISGLLDQYGRPFREQERNAALLRDGSAPTVRAVGSGAARLPRDEDNHAVLQTIDVTTRIVATVAPIPTYPFRSSLTVAVSPDGKRLAILATLGALAPQAGRMFPNEDLDEWTVERRLGFADVGRNAPVRWVTMPADGRYPLMLYGWSPDSRRVAFRARADGYATLTPLFVASADKDSVSRLGAFGVDGAGSGAEMLKRSPVLWADATHLLARLNNPAAKRPADWWMLGVTGTATNITHGASLPAGFWRRGDGRLVAMSGEQLVRLDEARARLAPIATIGQASVVWPEDPGRATAMLLVAVNGDWRPMETANGKLGGRFRPTGTRVDLLDYQQNIILWSQYDQNGLTLNITPSGGETRNLLALDSHLEKIDWGKLQVIEYRSSDGKPLKAIAILPPYYKPAVRYPMLVWVYGGYVIRDPANDYFTDPFAAGLYNLQLYAAHGYVVLIPSMPEAPREERNDVYANVPKGVLPAIDKMVELGIADSERLGVFGQSNGGMSVYSIVSQTHRFKAAVGLAGLTDLTSLFGEFDPLARGWPGIEHEMSENWSIMPFNGRHVPPPGDAAGYARNSPLTYADKIETPLLLIHGELDMRGSSGQAEELFTALWHQGKTAKLLRYGGESHSLAQSPANARDIYAQTLDWFDKYLGSP